MKRTFHSRFTLLAKLEIALLGCVSFWLLWQTSVVAIVPMVLLVIAIERVIHTEYSFDERGTLTVARGRFSRTVTIDTDRVEGIRQVRSIWGRGLVIEYSGHRRLYVCPRNEGEFIRMIYRDKKYEKTV